MASIEDCVLLSPALTDTVGVWYQADLSRTDQGWVVAAVRVPFGGGCVPRGDGRSSHIAGYEAYYEAESEFWDPPDPGSSLLGQVLLEPQKSFIIDRPCRSSGSGCGPQGPPGSASGGGRGSEPHRIGHLELSRSPPPTTAFMTLIRGNDCLMSHSSERGSGTFNRR